MKTRTIRTTSDATVIDGSALVIPVKAVIWAAVVVIGILLGGYVALFGWLAGEVVSLGKGQAALTESVERVDASLIELKEETGRRFDRLEDFLREQFTPE